MILPQLYIYIYIYSFWGLTFSLTHTRTHTLSFFLYRDGEDSGGAVRVGLGGAASLAVLCCKRAPGDVHGRRSSPSVRRSLNSGDDSPSSTVKVADYQSQYNEWVRFQTEALNDYPPAAANPGGPYSTP